MKKLIAVLLAAIMVFGTYAGMTIEAYAANYKIKSVTLSKTTYVYNGKVKKPKVVVKNSRNKTIPSKGNYTVKYPKNVNVGQRYVVITFKGKYKRNKAVKKRIRIIPQNTEITAIKAKVGGFTVKWKKVPKEVTGYQVQYSTNKKFPKKGSKTLTVKGNKQFSRTITGLAQGKRYFVRARTYKNVKKKNYYSNWKAQKNITTSKKAKPVTYTVLVKNKLRLGSDGMYQIVNEKGKWIGVDKYYAGTTIDSDDGHDLLQRFCSNIPYWTDVKTKENGDIIYQVKDGVKQSIEVKPYVTNTVEVKEYYKLLYNAYKTMHITDKMTDFEKYLIISKWFYNNVKYAYKSDGKTPDHNYACAIYALKNGKTICGGTASLTLDFCYLSNINCKYIINKSGSHAWNAVKLNNYWYQSDFSKKGYLYCRIFSDDVNDVNNNYFAYYDLIYNDEEYNNVYHYNEAQKYEEIQFFFERAYNSTLGVERENTSTWSKLTPKGTKDTIYPEYNELIAILERVRDS